MKRVILLADDSPTIQRLVLQTFVDSDFQIVSVSNGDAAIRKFEEVRPDLVLADIFMPGKNGYEVCDYVKRHAELGATPVILLAGAFDAFDQNTARQIGAATHITKPFEPHALVDLVESLTANAPKVEEPQTETVAAPVTAPPVAASADEVESTPTPSPEPEPEPYPGLPMPVEAAAPAPEPTPEPVPEPVSEPVPEQVSEPLPEPTPEPAATLAATVPEPLPAAAPAPVPTPAPARTDGDNGDLLGLNDLFKPATAGPVTEEEIERIADRVIKKLSTQVIENVAWDVVPEITSKVLKDELKRES